MKELENIHQSLNSQKAPHSSPSWLGYGVSITIASIWRKTDSFIIGSYCYCDLVILQSGFLASDEFIPGRDILDIWFDSGSTWAAVLEGNDAHNTPQTGLLIERISIGHVTMVAISGTTILVSYL